MPAAAPAKAKTSMMTTEFSCMVSRRIVALRKPSAVSFITWWRRPSALNTLSVVRPWMDSRNIAPRSV